MNALNQVTEYLRQKVSKVNINNPKANSGAVLLRLYKEFEDEVDNLVGIAFHTIQLHFTTDNSSNPAGTGGLTMISSAIGMKVHKYIDREPCPWNMQVRLGDLFVEAFYNCGYVDIYYPKARDTSYIVSATNKWTELADLPEMMARIRLTGTTTDKPVPNAKVKNQDKPSFDDLPWTRAMKKLQTTGWRINRRVYDALTANKDMFVSTQPILDNDAKEMKRRSKSVEWAFITAKAKMLVDEDVFYQEMEADYRGRLYYTEAFLNYQGSDLARGMLKFARGKPMTESGLWWLAVHTANSFNRSYSKDEIPEWVEGDYVAHLEAEGLDSISVDKWTLEDRVRWTNAHMDIIIEAGRIAHIFDDAEKPVSLLAACIEWYDYSVACDAKRIYFTHLPIGIDGSNNGWQHLGAISKDSHTGNLVGLAPNEIQRDFYVATAKELHSLSDGRLEELLETMPMKHIRKGISKRGSMTRAYSAGANKIGENMWFDCKAEDYHDKYGITDKDCSGFAKLLIKAIDTVCPGPLETMGYLQSLAKFEIGEYKKFSVDGTLANGEYGKAVKQMKVLYSKKDKTDEELEELNELVKTINSYETKKVYGNGSDRITWYTPSGFRVEYTNFNTSTRKCRGTISGYKSASGGAKTINHVARVPTTTPDVRGFMCGISPNFIHSMDASHMALVIDAWNGDFGAVHDSFSTHACDVDDLLALTKQTFVEMYDVDNFYDYIEDQLITNKEGLDVAQPTLGTLDIGGIYESDYFFA